MRWRTPKTETLDAATVADIPTTVDDIIRQQRDLYTMRVATPEDVAHIAKPLTAEYVKDTLTDWHLIWVASTGSNGHGFLVGESQVCGTVYSTSSLTAIDLDAGLAVTLSGSIYRLMEAGQSEPPLRQRLHICVVLHTIGVGEMLGVPKVMFC